MKALKIRFILAMALCLILLPGTALAVGDVAINADTFPDQNFREAVKAFDTDKNGSFSPSELAAVTKLDVSRKGIRTLEGIACFQALEHLNCGGNSLTSLELNNLPKLTSLRCFGNASLQHIQVGPQLLELFCNDCTQLQTLNTAAWPELEVLDCTNIGLTGALSFPLNAHLETLNCGKNHITELDFRANRLLQVILCLDDPSLKKIDISSGASYGGNGRRYPVQLMADFNLQPIEIIAPQGSFDFTCLEFFKSDGRGNGSTKRVCNEPEIKEQLPNGTLLSLTQTPTKIRFGSGLITLSVPPKLMISDLYFPDPVFRDFVGQYDLNGDGYLEVDGELSQITEVNCSNMGIRSLTGIEHFFNLKKLDCSNNQLACVNVRHLEQNSPDLNWRYNFRQVQDEEWLGAEFNANNIIMVANTGGYISHDSRVHFDPGKTVIQYGYAPKISMFITLWRALLEQDGTAVKVSSRIPSRLILATYSSSGQLVSTRVHELPANTDGQSFEAGTATKAFLVDEQGAPLCSALDLS